MRLAAGVLAALLTVGALAPAMAEDPPKGFILPQEGYSWAFDGDGDTQLGPPYWTPSLQDIAAAEAKLSDYLLVAPNEDAHDIPPRLDRYGRQYFGVSVRGRRILVINAFCRPFDEKRLRASLIMIADGGDCYFEAFYDMTTGKFAGISVNGYA